LNSNTEFGRSLRATKRDCSINENTIVDFPIALHVLLLYFFSKVMIGHAFVMRFSSSLYTDMPTDAKM
jgi:hypothetical protein